VRVKAKPAAVAGAPGHEGGPLEDAELVDRARGGDVGAYEALVARYQRIAVRTAYLITGNSADAEDVAQDAFLKAYRTLDRFRRDAPFRPWILAIVTNEARNRGRASRRRATLALRVAADAQREAEPSAEAAVLALEDQRRLLEAMERLRDGDRLVLGYRYLLELSEAETAAALGCRRGTVKSRLSRALERLRRDLASDAEASFEEAVDG
jgi:RNA polymerase sigma factor (sigma-70 family)